jgi:hypothetical protein
MGKNRDKQTIIFLHIPKTAGTTLHRIIERHYPRDRIYTFWQDGSPEDFENLSHARRSEFYMLRGHVGFGVHELLPGPSTYFTVLREPIDRVVSYYYFVRRTSQHYCHELVTSNNMSLKEFVNSRRDFMVDNGQTRMLSGLGQGHELGFGKCTKEHLEKAKRNLQEKFSVVGLTEAFDETLLLLKSEFGWRKIFYARQNVSTDRPIKDELSQSTLNAIAQNNLLDFELYRFATSLFEDHICQRSSSFTREVRKFQSVNRELSPFTHIYWGIRNLSIRTYVRNILRRIFGNTNNDALSL